jgi:hypothetical protein
MVLGQIAGKVPVVDLEKRTVAEHGDRGTLKMGEPGPGPIEKPQTLGLGSSSQIHVLEPGWVEGRVEATQTLQAGPGQGQGRRRWLLHGLSDLGWSLGASDGDGQEGLEQELAGSGQAFQLPRGLAAAIRALQGRDETCRLGVLGESLQQIVHSLLLG